MIPPETPSPFEGKTVFGTGCENCAKLQAENKRLKEENRWIPVSERLPELWKYILVYNPLFNPAFFVVVETDEKNRQDYTLWKPIILPDQVLQESEAKE